MAGGYININYNIYLNNINHQQDWEEEEEARYNLDYTL